MRWEVSGHTVATSCLSHKTPKRHGTIYQPLRSGRI